VDEKYLPGVAEQVEPRAIALLNLSRDQLDRAAETRMMAQKWRDGLAETPATVIANADDPLVVWAAGRAREVVWVAVGQSWKDDAWSCPQCGGVLRLADEDWSCGSCDLRRPTPQWSLDGGELVAPDGARVVLGGLRLPGRANRANAVSAAATVAVFGVEPAVAIERMEHVTAVAGRYDTVTYRGRTLRLLLAKNPAGWLETFDLVAPAGATPEGPVLLSVNALSADGTDTSWLWDVDYTRLVGHRVLVIGQRRLDLAVRLQVAGVDFQVFDDVEAAVAKAPAGPIDAIANYTAFQQLRQKVGA
jgi:UDP-N-acetylmuramyl tripeptide synthase